MVKRILNPAEVSTVAVWQAPEMNASGAVEDLSPYSMGGDEERIKVAASSLSPEILQPLTAEKLTTLEATARAAGFQSGQEEGRVAAAEEIRQQAECLAVLIDSIARPLDVLDQSVERELLHLATMIARHIVRRELQTAPGEIVGVIREALKLLPSQTTDVRLELHPLDAKLVRETLPEGEGERAWRIAEDPALTRGGCRIMAQTGQIDATVESRLNKVIAAVLGDTRAASTVA